MAGPFDFTGQNIEDSYQRVLQTDGTSIYDGTGSLFSLPTISTGSFATTGSNTFIGNQIISGNVTVSGTASINTLVVNQTVLSTGSNQLGDAANDTQTLYGSVIIPTGSLTVTGSLTATNITPTNITTNYFPKKSGTFLTSSVLNSPDDATLHWGPPLITPTTPNVRTISIWGLNYVDFALRVSGSSANTGDLMQVRPGGGFAFSNMVYNQQIFSIGSDVAVSALGIIGSAGNVEMGRNGGNVGINWPNGYTIPAKFYVSGSSRFDGAVTINGTGATSATTAFNVRNVNASASLVVLDNGTVGIGTTTPSSSILLDVSGSVRTMNIVPAAHNTYILGASNNLWANLFVQNATLNTVYTGNVRSNNTGGVKISSNNANQWAQWFDTTGNLTLQNGGTFTDNGYRLQINATGSDSGSLFVGGTDVAFGGTARTMLISSSLSASANNDVLVGLDIQSTFTPGAFTGVAQIGLRTNGSVQSPIFYSVTSLGLSSGASTQPISFYLNQTSTLIGRFFGTTGNLLLQNGGTFTDSGFRLDVSGSARVTNNLTVTGSTTLTNGQTTIQGAGATSATTALVVRNSTPTNIITVLNNSTVGINRTPTASLDVAGTTRLSGSFNTAASGSILTVIGSGSTQPIFTVQGSQGELFSITDSLTGSLFSVNDISGLPILEVFSDNTTLIGDYQDPALITTTKKTANTGVTTIYSLPTASYDGAWFDYTIRSGSNARVGTVMGMWSGSSVNYTETSASQFGTTSGFTFGMSISGSNMILSGSATTSGWTVKTIIRSI